MEKIELLEVQSQRLYFRRLRATDLGAWPPAFFRTRRPWRHGTGRMTAAIRWILSRICCAATARTASAMSQPSKSRRTSWWRSAACSRSSLDGRPAVSLGCIVRSEKRFHGFGRECLSAMLSCAFARLELDRVVSFIRLDNVGALQTAAAFGMEAGRPLRARPCRSGRPSRWFSRCAIRSAAPGGIN